MFNILELARRFQNQWIVLDGDRQVVDHGPELAELRTKHQGARRTFFFVSPA